MDKRKGRLSMAMVTILLVLMLSAMWAVPVLADDGTTPPPEESPPAEVVVEEVPPVEEMTEEVPPVEEQVGPPLADKMAEPPLAAQETGEGGDELLSQLPDETEVVVTDESGETLPLVTKKAAEAVAGGDPIWCPAGVTPQNGLGGCTSAYSSMQDLINDLAGNQQAKNGVIWVEKTYDSSVNDPGVTNFTLDGTGAFATMANYTLMMQGGWNGLGSVSVDKTAPSEFNASLQILGWNNNVTVNDLLFTGVPGGVGPALVVESTKNVIANRIVAESNTEAGVVVDTTSGTAGNVNITLSQFLNNGGDGLQVYASGTITLIDVLAIGNAGDGAYLDNSGAATAKNVTVVAGYNEFSGNGVVGLEIYSKGGVTLKDLTALDNGDYGAWIDNTFGVLPVTLTGTNIVSQNFGGIAVFSKGKIQINNLVANANGGDYGAFLDNSTATTAQPVILTGTNEFKYNASGLYIGSQGAITLSNVAANNNYAGNGAYLANDFGFASNVVLSGVNTFNNNGDYGLIVYSYGTVTTSNLSASGNGYDDPGYGAWIYNAGAASPKLVTLNGTNDFGGNNLGGLYVGSKGAIKVNNLSAGGNGAEGAQLDNWYPGAVGPITLTGTYSWFGNNGADGLIVYSTGAITISKISANDNGGYGAYLQNDSNPAKPQNVTLSGYASFWNNGLSGAEVDSYGAVTLFNVDASNNGFGGGGVGLLVDTCRDTGSGCTGTLPRPVLLNGYGNFNDNADDGLVILALGPITVQGVYAERNGGGGAYLDNAWLNAVGGITINGENGFNENGLDGLLAYSTGNILLKDLDAWGNGGDGAILNNTFGAAGNVIVGTTRPNWCNGFSDNYNSGLEIYSPGAVTLFNLCNSNNGDPTAGTPYGYGLYVDNTFATTPKPVVLNGDNSFYNNYSGGMNIFSLGAIKTNNLDASDNVGPGAILDNSLGGNTIQQPVTMTGWNDFWRNGEEGLIVTSYGNISLSNLNANENGSWGAYLDNYLGDALTPRTVTLLGYGTIRDNGGDGLQVFSLGNITLYHLYVNNNNGDGAYLDNQWPGSNGVISLMGNWNSFHNNNGDGLIAFSYRTISIASGLSANYNVGDGVYLDNSAGAGPITITGNANFNGNGGVGLTVVSNGAIVTQTLDAHDNADSGVVLYNQFDPTKPQNVTLSGNWHNFSNNGGSGLSVDSFGVITISNLDAYNNGYTVGGWGAYLDNCSPTTPPDCAALLSGKPITLTGYNNFNQNADGGLSATSLGAITVFNLSANNNGGDGVYLDNQWFTQGGLPAVGNLTLTGNNNFYNNAGWGLDAFSMGAITMSNVSAGGNFGGGAYLDTFGWSAPKNVTLTGYNNFNNNGDFVNHVGDGLVVYADGLITISNLTASGNAFDGAYLNNYDYNWIGSPGITLTGYNYFNDNYNNGLYFDSTGAVKLSRVTADGNGFIGVEGYTDGSILLACGSMTMNGDLGLYLWSPALVTLQGVHAYGNGNPFNWFVDGGATLIVKRGC